MNLKPLLAAGIIAATPFAASASTLIDDFTIFQTVTDIEQGGNGDFEQAGTIVDPGPPYEWDRRQLRANLLSGEGCIGPEGDEICKNVTAVIGGGDFVYESSPATESWVEVRYRYDDEEGYDLTSTGDAFAFVFDGVDTDQEFGLLIRLRDGEDNASEFFFQDAIDDGQIIISFADILGDDETDLTMLNRIDFQFTTRRVGTDSLDLEIKSITTAIPLPAGVLLMGTALAGFGVMRRRQKRAAA